MAVIRELTVRINQEIRIDSPAIELNLKFLSVVEDPPSLSVKATTLGLKSETINMVTTNNRKKCKFLIIESPFSAMIELLSLKIALRT